MLLKVLRISLADGDQDGRPTGVEVEAQPAKTAQANTAEVIRIMGLCC